MIIISSANFTHASEKTDSLTKDEKTAIAATGIGFGSLVLLNMYARKKANDAIKIDTEKYTHYINDYQDRIATLDTVLTQLKATGSKSAENVYEIDYENLNNFINNNENVLVGVLGGKKPDLSAIKKAMENKQNIDQSALLVYFEVIQSSIEDLVSKVRTLKNEAEYEVNVIKAAGFLYTPEESGTMRWLSPFALIGLNIYMVSNFIRNVLFNWILNRPWYK